MKQVETHWFNIYCGIRENYEGVQYSIQEAMKLCQKYCDEVGLCVTITNTYFIYTKGREPGIIVGLINYPRFPKSEEETLLHAKKIGKLLMDNFKQQKVSIVGKDFTLMLEEKDDVL